MVYKRDCSFCSYPVYPGHGIRFIRNDCKEFNFCSSKCHKAFKKKRNPRKTGWTKTYRKLRGKDLTNDSVFDFEKRRNTLPKYSRELHQQTVEIMGKVAAIRQKRERFHIMNRLKVGTKNRKIADIRAVETEMHLIQAPHATRNVMDDELKEKDVTMEEEMISEEEIDMDVDNVALPKKKTPTKKKMKLTVDAGGRTSLTT